MKKLFIGIEETNLGEFVSPCCHAAMSIEPLCRLFCAMCEKSVEYNEVVPMEEVEP